ncbi:MAG: rhodanese-like domain-containing protein [Planctomycetes bacterium]|nr:rhodanese-like domain-containing protein [Planctomycetota bacterium]
MKTITTETLRARLDAGPVALFDVRGDVDFEIGHIPGASTAPLGSLVFRVARLMNPESFVAVYSGGGACRLASEAARRLESLGLTNVHCYADGLAGWRAAGLPVVPSKNAKVHTQGPVEHCRPLVVDTARAYGGAFSQDQSCVEGAGG